MEEVLVSFEVAKLAKEIGIDGLNCNYVVCIGFNDMEEDRNYIHSPRNSVKGQFHLALVPTQNLLQKYLREAYKIEIIVLPCWSKKSFGGYYVEILDLTKNYHSWETRGIIEYKSYEEALETGLLESLKLLTNQQS